MKVLCLLALFLSATFAKADIVAAGYDMAAVRDPATLETRVVQDWKPMAKDPAIRQKVVEITICEWWPGQRVRLPVTFNAPVSGGPCKHVIIANAGLPVRAATPPGSMLRLLKEHGVGVVLIGMGTIDAMEPAGQLHVGMKEHLLKTKDMRYTPAWIWGMSDMRALTAALTEKEAFQPQKVLATGGSKRGVATAAAGIADERFTAIMPVVAPIIESPGGPYVHGMMPNQIVRENERFLLQVRAGKVAGVPATAPEALAVREKARSDERITVEQARDAGWTVDEMKAASNAAWEVCRVTNYLPALKQHGVEVFYNQGTNDNVTPGLLALGATFPDFPICVVPGGQHGGSKETGFTKQVGSLPEVDENLFAFAQHHFFGTRPLVATPRIVPHWDPGTQRLLVIVTFPDRTEPQTNDLWWSADRHADYTFAMEYDVWQSAPLKRTGTATYIAEVSLPSKPKTLDVVTVHRHTANDSTLTISSPLIRLE